jgi:hypothetical protein
MPLGWHVVPSGDDDLADAWEQELIAGHAADDRDKERLRGDFARLRSFMARGHRPGRRWLVALPPYADVRQVITAVGWCDALPGADFDQAAEALHSSTSVLPVGVVSRQVEERKLGGRRTVLCLDLVGTRSSDTGTVLHERFAALSHDEQTGCAVRLEVTTSDLAAFEDLLETGSQLVSGLRLAVA